MEHRNRIFFVRLQREINNRYATIADETCLDRMFIHDSLAPQISLEKNKKHTAPSLTQYVKCMFPRRGKITQTTLNEAQRPRKVPYMNQDRKKVYCRSTLYGGQFRLSPRQLIKPNILYYPPLMQHHSFFRNRYPIYTWRSCLNSFVRDSRVSASENRDQKRQIGRQKKNTQ